MQSFSPKQPTDKLRLSPLSVLSVGLAMIAMCFMAAHPPVAAAQGNAAVLTPPAATPPPRKPPTYPNAKQEPMMGIPAVHSASGGAITEADVMTFVQRHRLPQSLSSDRGTIVSVQEETGQQVAATLQSTGLPDTTLLWVVELSGHFVFAGSSHQLDGLAFPDAFEVFIASTGNLVMAGGLAQPLSTPPSNTPTPATATPVPTQPTATPTTLPPTAVPTTAPPTPTPMPSHPPILSVRPMATTEDCAGNSYPNPITVLNSGSGTLTWSATAPSGVTLTPSSGSLAAGASQSITLAGLFTSATSFVVHFTSNGGTTSVAITCQRIA